MLIGLLYPHFLHIINYALILVLQQCSLVKENLTRSQNLKRWMNN